MAIEAAQQPHGQRDELVQQMLRGRLLVPAQRDHLERDAGRRRARAVCAGRHGLELL
jgi:hypothetical protein